MASQRAFGITPFKCSPNAPPFLPLWSFMRESMRRPVPDPPQVVGGHMRAPSANGFGSLGQRHRCDPCSHHGHPAKNAFRKSKKSWEFVNPSVLKSAAPSMPPPRPPAYQSIGEGLGQWGMGNGIGGCYPLTGLFPRRCPECGTGIAGMLSPRTRGTALPGGEAAAHCAAEAGPRMHAPRRHRAEARCYVVRRQLPARRRPGSGCTLPEDTGRKPGATAAAYRPGSFARHMLRPTIAMSARLIHTSQSSLAVTNCRDSSAE